MVINDSAQLTLSKKLKLRWKRMMKGSWYLVVNPDAQPHSDVPQTEDQISWTTKNYTAGIVNSRSKCPSSPKLVQEFEGGQIEK